MLHAYYIQKMIHVKCSYSNKKTKHWVYLKLSVSKLSSILNCQTRRRQIDANGGRHNGNSATHEWWDIIGQEKAIENFKEIKKKMKEIL